MAVGLNFGLALNSRQGLSNMSFGANLQQKENITKKNECGETVATKDFRTTGSGNLASAAFDFGAPSFSPQIGLPIA